MPTYQYRCQTCTGEFEVRQSFTDDALTACPADGCNGPVNKVFSGVGISFKGDGFYKNDHGASAKSRPTEDSKSAVTSETSSSSDDSSSKSPNDGASSSVTPKKASGETTSESKPAAATPKASKST